MTRHKGISEHNAYYISTTLTQIDIVWKPKEQEKILKQINFRGIESMILRFSAIANELFQKQNNINPDGIVGRRTIMLINQLTNEEIPRIIQESS